MPTSDQISVGVDISEQELWYILSQFPSRAIPSARVPDLPDTELLINLKAAEASLLARGLLTIESDVETGKAERHLDKTVGVLVGTGLIAERVLLLTFETGPLNAETTWIYFAPEITVAHSRPSSQIHRFVMINTGDLFISTLILSLRLDLECVELPQLSSFTTPRSLFIQMREEPDHAYDLLIGALQLEQSTAQAFAKVAVAPDSYSQVILVGREDNISIMEFRLLYSSEVGYWLIKDHGDDLWCEPITPFQITDMINRSVREALEAIRKG